MPLFTRPGVAGAVLQTPPSFNHSFNKRGHFPPNLHNIIPPKPWELESWNFERMLTPHHVSHVMYHVSCVMCQVSGARCQVSGDRCNFFLFLSFFPGQSCGASRWRVCYQRGLPCLVYPDIGNFIKKSLYSSDQSDQYDQSN